jgi:hypothetical protein
MAIISTDIQKRYSVVAGTGDSSAGAAASSLGDQVSTTAITDDTFGNLFPDITGDEAAAGVVKYRCIFVLNNHATLTLTNAQVSIASQIANGSTIAIATDNIAASAKGSGSAQAATVANENTAPSGVSAFGVGPLSLGSLTPGQVKGVWIRQTTPTGATPPGSDGVDNFILSITGDTLP